MFSNITVKSLPVRVPTLHILRAYSSLCCSDEDVIVNTNCCKIHYLSTSQRPVAQNLPSARLSCIFQIHITLCIPRMKTQVFVFDCSRVWIESNTLIQDFQYKRKDYWTKQVNNERQTSSKLWRSMTAIQFLAKKTAVTCESTT